MVKILDTIYKWFVPIFAGAITFLRLTINEKDYLINNFWAEDGLFTICYLKYNHVTCFFDSYSGYLVFYPRLIASIVQLFPLSYWPLVSNSIYLIVVVITLYFLQKIFKYIEDDVVTKISLMTPFILAISSDQILGVHSSYYLIITAFLIIIVAKLDYLINIGRLKKLILGLIFLLHALSTPFSFILLLIVFYKIITRNVKIKDILNYIVCITSGFMIQLLTILNADETRSSLNNIELLFKNSFNYLLKSIISIFYYPNELKLNDQIFVQQKIVSFLYSYSYLPIILIFTVLITPLLIYNKFSLKVKEILLIFWALILILLISSYTNGWPYRFIVLTSTLFLYLIIKSLTLILNKKIIIILIPLLLGNNLINNFAVSGYRTEGPKWQFELEKIHNECINSKESKTVFFTFYPNWPTTNPHAYGLREPTTNAITCHIFTKVSS